MKAFTVFILSAGIAVLPLAAADDGITGKWQVHQSIAGNDSDQTCTFTQSGTALSGTCESDQGKVEITGAIEEKKVSWSYKSEYNGTPLTVKFEGTFEAGKISGSVSVPEFSVEGDFLAKPAK
jgi:hypothetical protein